MLATDPPNVKVKLFNEVPPRLVPGKVIVLGTA